MRFVLFILLLAQSCTLFYESTPKAENKDGTVGFVEPLWKIKNYKTDFENVKITIGYTFANSIYNGKAFIKTIGSDGYQSLTAVDIKTGKELWEWNDVFDKKPHDIDLTTGYIYNNILTYVVGTRRYGININTGKTTWKDRKKISFSSRMNGMGEHFYINGPTNDPEKAKTTKEIIWRGDVNTGVIEEYIYPDIPETYKEGWLGTTSFDKIRTFEKNGEKFALLSPSNSFENSYYDVTIDLYNMTKEEWVYTRKEVSPPTRNGTTRSIYVYKDRVYLQTGGFLNCHDLWTGKRIWRRGFDWDFTSGFILVGDRLIGNHEGRRMICLNIDTGASIWEKETTYGFSALRHLNGVIYHSGGGTNRIHARRLSDGQEIWQLNPENYDGAEDFKPDLYAIDGENGKKGKLIIQTYGHAYCIEAYQ